MADQPDFDRAREEAAAAGFPGMPEDMTELTGMVATTCELFESHVNGGFTSSQALYLVGVIMTGNPGIPPQR